MRALLRPLRVQSSRRFTLNYVTVLQRNLTTQRPLYEQHKQQQERSNENEQHTQHTHKTRNDNRKYSPFFRSLMHDLPHPHTPTKEELLGLANGFFERLRIRWKWWTIRGFRKFNADDVSAFVSWLLVGHIFWILVGTTTFFSAIFATANSLRLQNYIAGAISDYLTQATGVSVTLSICYN